LRALQFVGRVERGATRRRFRGKHGGLHPPYALVKRSRSRLRHHLVDQCPDEIGRSVFGRFNSLIGGFNSLFVRFISLFGRVGNLPSGIS
jgi:hypothetical protein